MAVTLGCRVVAVGVLRLWVDFGGRTDKICCWIRWGGRVREKEKSKLIARFGAGASGTKEWQFIEMGRLEDLWGEMRSQLRISEV